MAKRLKAYRENKDTDDQNRHIRVNEKQADYVAAQLRQRLSQDLMAQTSDTALNRAFNMVSWPVSLATLSKKSSALESEMMERLTFFMDRQVMTGNDFKASLSGGEKQKLMIALVLLHKPDVLILDEITAALDEETGAELYGQMMDQLPEDTIVLSIAHNKHILKYHTHHAHLENQGISIVPVEQSALDQSRAPTPSGPGRTDKPSP